ncbi:hypothetical protein C7410_1084 [Paraburkholderia silvatlantica]|uniref:Uncharacterized protein n=1 Tax=Paraburkholderia silvatlantica TaxID=321895 RepID=A0A2V4TC04_9BURK|nr:hypothetical protein C7410_1084 [Paraburkholderia silvatlantica]
MNRPSAAVARQAAGSLASGAAGTIRQQLGSQSHTKPF